MAYVTLSKDQFVDYLKDPNRIPLMTCLQNEATGQIDIISFHKPPELLDLLVNVIPLLLHQLQPYERAVLLVHFHNPDQEHKWSKIEPSISIRGCQQCWEIAMTRLLWDKPELRAIIEKALTNYTLLKLKKK